MSWIEKVKNKVPCLLSKRTSFTTMTLLLGVFFLVEVTVGYMTNSMALIADSFHMLSDVASLVVGYLALQYSNREGNRETYTFGYARAEVLGALVNAVFLVALCFSITIEALKRLVILEEIDNPVLVFCVGAIGLVINIFGMFLFHQTGHGHTHGGLSHGHSHGTEHSHGPDGHGHGHSHDSNHSHSHGNGNSHGEASEDPNNSKDHSGDSGKQYFTESATLESIEEKNENEKLLPERSQSVEKPLDTENPNTYDKDIHGEQSQDSSINLEHFENRKYPARKQAKSAGHLNIQGVYLHILGDALGSIIVMVSALIIIYAHGKWTLYVDPSMSIIMVVIILKTSIPLLVETSKILMNSVPHHIQINDIRERLMKRLPQIKNVHELHVWQLAGDKIIASAHVKFESEEDYEEVAAKIKEFFHDEGIHSTTVQIEFEKNDEVNRRGACMVVCSLDSACDDMMCCKPDTTTMDPLK